MTRALILAALVLTGCTCQWQLPDDPCMPKAIPAPVVQPSVPAHRHTFGRDGRCTYTTRQNGRTVRCSTRRRDAKSSTHPADRLEHVVHPSSVRLGDSGQLRESRRMTAGEQP